VCSATRASHGRLSERTKQANMATVDDVIGKIFGKMDIDNSGSICQDEMSATFVVFDRDGELLYDTIRYDTTWYFNARLTANINIT